MINHRIIILVLSFLLFAGNGWGATYYVDQTGGSDSNLGTATGSAWKTISKVNGSSFSVGDFILFKRGETWVEILTPPSSGSSGNPITFGAYGSGASPIITGRASLSGWNTAGNWTVYSGNIWQFSYTHNPGHIYLSGTKAQIAETASGVNSTYKWAWVSNVLYVYSTSNPASAFSNVEGNTLQQNVYVVNKHYLTFQNLDFRNGWNTIFSLYGTDGITIDSNAVGYDAGQYGIFVENYPGVHNTSDDLVVSNNTIDANYGYMNTFNRQMPNDGIRISYGVNGARIYNNTIADWHHTGINFYASDNTYTNNNIWIYNNTFDGSGTATSRGIAMDSRRVSTTGNKVYKNLIRNMKAQSQLNTDSLEFYYNIVDNVVGDPFVNKEGDGINLMGYSNTHATNMKIYNNVFANCREPGIVMLGGGNNISGNEITNNIFYNNGYNSQFAVYGLYSVNNTQIAMFDQASVLANTFKNNLFYNGAVTDLVSYGHDTANDYFHTVAEFNAENGTAGDVISGNIAGNPSFVSSSDFSIQSSSPAINAGVNVGLTTDYVGNLIIGSPDIGAYEFQGTGILKYPMYPSNIIVQ